MSVPDSSHPQPSNGALQRMLGFLLLSFRNHTLLQEVCPVEGPCSDGGTTSYPSFPPFSFHHLWLLYHAAQEELLRPAVGLLTNLGVTNWLPAAPGLLDWHANGAISTAKAHFGVTWENKGQIRRVPSTASTSPYALSPSPPHSCNVLPYSPPGFFCLPRILEALLASSAPTGEA